MGFMAAAIPLVAGVLGSMGKDEQQPGPAVPPPPTLGEMFAANSKNYASPPQYAMPNTSQVFSNSPVGGGVK